MPKLSLNQSYINPNNKKEACLYIYYGTQKNPVDHNGKAIPQFSDDPPEDFRAHLRENLVPSLNEIFINKGSNYEATDVVFENQAPHPVTIIQRKDGKILNPTDMQYIKHQVETSLKLLNKNESSSQNNAGMFSHKKEIISKEEHKKGSAKQVCM